MEKPIPRRKSLRASDLLKMQLDLNIVIQLLAHQMPILFPQEMGMTGFLDLAVQIELTVKVVTIRYCLRSIFRHSQ